MPVHKLDIDGGELHVRLNGTGPLLICAPGMGESSDGFDAIASQLTASGFSVAQLDNRGAGESSTTFTEYGDEATARDFILIAERLASGPAVLAGVSFAGGAATIAAGRRPDLFAGVVLLGAFLRNPPGASVMMPILGVMLWKPFGPSMWEMYAATLFPGLGDKAKERAKKGRAELTREGRWAAFQKLVGSLDHSTVTPWISKVKAPVLVVMGAKDPDWSKPLEEADWIASNFTGARVVAVEGAGHAPMLEKPDVVGKEVLAFMQEVK